MITRFVPLALEGRMVRRLLVNATVDVDHIAPLLPEGRTPARLGQQHDRALVGVCLLRLAELRPAPLPAGFGRAFDGLAYRIAVTTRDGTPGVHIVRRETDDRLARLVGGRLFPGSHRPVDMEVTDDLRVVARGHGGPALVVDVLDEAPPRQASVLGGDDAASAFFSAATIATSPARRRGTSEGLRMAAPPFTVRAVRHRELVLDRLAWALGVPHESLEVDSVFLVRDVPVRFTPIALSA